jgi:hypothetical protein
MSNPKRLVVAGEDDKGVAAGGSTSVSRSQAQALWAGAGPDQRRVQWRAQLPRNRIDIDNHFSSMLTVRSFIVKEHLLTFFFNNGKQFPFQPSSERTHVAS